MAMFKVGDRVLVVAGDHAFPCVSFLVGRTGVVAPPVLGQMFPVRVLLDNTLECTFVASELAPLTPPAEDAWAADAVRKVTKPLHTEPVKVTA